MLPRAPAVVNVEPRNNRRPGASVAKPIDICSARQEDLTTGRSVIPFPYVPVVKSSCRIPRTPSRSSNHPELLRACSLFNLKPPYNGQLLEQDLTNKLWFECQSFTLGRIRAFPSKLETRLRIALSCSSKDFSAAFLTRASAWGRKMREINASTVISIDNLTSVP